MADKYRCYGKDDFGHPYDALSMKDEYGEWVRAEDYVALEAETSTYVDEIVSEKRALAADRDQISLTLAVAKADRDKWFNRARVLEAALREAKEIVKVFHDMGTPKHVQAELWDLYQQSPEMKRLNAALTPQETPAEPSGMDRWEAQNPPSTADSPSTFISNRSPETK